MCLEDDVSNLLRVCLRVLSIFPAQSASAHALLTKKILQVCLLVSGVGTYTDTPDWSGQSFWKIILRLQLEIEDSIPLY